jgi:hypothetical protein
MTSFAEQLAPFQQRPITSFMGRNPSAANWYTFVNDCCMDLLDLIA